MLFCGNPFGARELDPDHLDALLDINTEALANARRRLPPHAFYGPMQGYDLATILIETLGDLKYVPAEDALFKLGGTDYDDVAARALEKLPPDEVANKLVATASDKGMDSYLREKALVTLCSIWATNQARALAPLLDDTTPIIYSPPLQIGRGWRICDSAAEAIAILLGWRGDVMSVIVRPEERDEMLARAREWAK